MIEAIRNLIRRLMTRLAKVLNTLFRGHLSPDFVSFLSLLGHVWILWLLVNGDFKLAAPLLVGFGLMDALDGALARLQGKPSAAGMLLDATSDRVKESLIYFGLSDYFLRQANFAGVRLALLTLAGSMLVSYVKAKGETALTDASANDKNQALKDGFARYEIRMAILLIGLLWPAKLVTVLAVLAVLAWLTAVRRFLLISEKLG